jgi:predicted NodU family carbamoyl transferase
LAGSAERTPRLGMHLSGPRVRPRPVEDGSTVPAIVHVDDTARPQLVRRDQNPL